MKLFNKDGVEMMEVKSIVEDGERLVVKGKIMGAMATSIYVSPEDLYAAFKLLPARLVLRLPWLLITGWRRARKAQVAA